MKTVLFIDKSDSTLWGSYLQHGYLLDEYQSEGYFCVCDWHRGGRTTEEAIPELSDLLDGEREWRAVVVDDLRDNGLSVERDLHFDNPFDFPENYGLTQGRTASESGRPIVRLTQMLGGLPEKASISWPDADEGHVANLNDFSVVPQQDDDSYDLVRRYRLGLPRPQVIACVTPREIDDDLMRLRLKDESLRPVEQELDFWQRNSYPASARFIVCDRAAAPLAAEEADAGYQSGRSPWFGFWLAVLSLAISPLDPSMVRPYRLHRLTAIVDEGAMEQVFSERLAEWAAMREVIAGQQEMDRGKLAASEFVMRDLPDHKVNIDVVFDLVSEDDLVPDTTEIHWFKDRPRSDMAVWKHQRNRILSEFKTLLRAPKRGVMNAAAQYRATRPFREEDLEYLLLNEYQTDIVLGELQELERQVAQGVAKPAFSFASYEHPLDKADRTVRSSIERRATLRQTGLAVGAVGLMLVLGFVPYMVGMAGSGIALSAGAVGVTLGCCAAVALVALATVWWLKKPLRSAYLKFGDMVLSVVDRLRSEASRVGERISAFASYRKLWSLYDRQVKGGRPTKTSIWLGKRDALLRARAQDLQRVMPCTMDADTYQRVRHTSWEAASALLRTPSFFTVCEAVPVSRPLDNGIVQQGEVSVPYNFVSSLLLEQITCH